MFTEVVFRKTALSQEPRNI